MDPEQLEELLPAYLDGALNAEQTDRVKTWLESSAEARRTLEEFRQLNILLESRRDLVPPAAPFARAALTPPLETRVRKVMDAIFSVQGISGLLIVLVGIMLFIYRQPITNWFNRTPDLPGSTTWNLEWLRTAILQFSGADIWTMTAIYAGVTLLILGSSSVMLMRYLRD
jgi:anti-sigma factor RsiW